MRIQIITGIVAGIIGGIIVIIGVITQTPKMINLGFAGVFIGATILALKSGEYVKADALSSTLSSYHLTLKSIVRDLGLEGNAIYIPPYENLPEGGVFIPLSRDFDLDLGRLGEDVVFLSSAPSERQMGILLKPTGLHLVKKFEEHLEGSLNGIGVGGVESVAGSVLKSLGLADEVYIEEGDDVYTIYVKPRQIKFCRSNIEDCSQVACPICSSILLGLSKGTGEVIVSENFTFERGRVKITARKLGGVERWM
ncbi:hypothetical protein [Pyrococcus sp. ST04]|uniref:hypothetical protein n=1 Tax=Pyrococcus sp. ST04 TaxID=1183377 RepID=UPI00064EB537|nr:hypothetical protein [Pyrococcus sp. ST04]